MESLLLYLLKECVSWGDVLALGMTLVLMFGGLIQLSQRWYEEGSKRGRIQSIAKEGLFWKTWEVEVSMEGFHEVPGVDGIRRSVPNIRKMSIYSDLPKEQGQLLRDLAGYFKSGAIVEFDYRRPYVWCPWKGDTMTYICHVRGIQ
jgi:hypothetical protein